MAPPCKFWQQGNCRNGNNCRFEHGSVNGGSQSGGYQSGNRFAPLQNQDNSRNASNRQASSARELPFQLDKAAIIIDLSSERPQWPLSAYGPGRFAPVQLFGGPLREQSFEEMRLMHYMGVASGNPQGAVQEAERMAQAAELQTQNALSNVDAGIDFIIKAQHEHPNRLDIIRDSMGGAIKANPFSSSAPAQTGNAFGAPTQSTPGAFGAPSQPGANPFGPPPQPSHTANAFGTPAFGAPSQTGAFGQPSTLGQKPNPFGAPSVPAFGGPSQLGRGGGAFGQPSALGQKVNPFGAPLGTTASGPAAAAPFSAFSQAPGAFNQAQATAAPGVFGAPSQHVASDPFNNTQQATPAFGAPTQPSSQANPFNAASSTPFGAPSPAPKNPFGTTTLPAAPNPFGTAPNPSQANPFGTNPTPATGPNPFGTTPSQLSNPFGTTSGPSVTSPFGTAPTAPQPNPFGAPTAAPAAFGPPSGQIRTANPFDTGGFSSMSNGMSASERPSGSSSGLALTENPDVSSYISKDGSGKLTMFKGKSVQYKDNNPGYIGPDGAWRRIFFPDGPPPVNKDTQVDDGRYEDGVKQAFEQLRLTGSFPNGEMPLLPPKSEWVRWDF